MSENPVSSKQGWWAAAGVVLVLMMASIILQVPRLHAQADRGACLSRLQAFAAAMAIYDTDNGGRSSASRKALSPDPVGEGIGARFFCPKSRNHYIYVGTSSDIERADPKRIVAYEPWTDQHGQGGCVVYADGRAEFLPTERYRAAVVGGG